MPGRSSGLRWSWAPPANLCAGRRFGELASPGACAMAQKILHRLWFDQEAKVAAEFYTSIFPRSRVTHLATRRDTPSGDCDPASFELAGFQLMAISAGPGRRRVR